MLGYHSLTVKELERFVWFFSYSGNHFGFNVFCIVFSKKKVFAHCVAKLFFDQSCGLWLEWVTSPFAEMSPSRRVELAEVMGASPQSFRSQLELLLLGCESGNSGGTAAGSWAGLGWRSCWKLALSLALLASLMDRTGSARVSSSLSTTHHVHHFHNKHGRVPIAINRMPILTRGFPSKSSSLSSTLSSALAH